MRDLGVLGEVAFSQMCAEVGLINNGSQIDKTGWDFYVECSDLPIPTTTELHKTPLECKVQVKATDKSTKKVSIKLTNLRRMATANMPTFFLFLEFSGKEKAQCAYLVHVDYQIITKVLERLHKINQSEHANNYNKRTITINYTEEHLLNEVSGNSLKEKLYEYIGSDYTEYVTSKIRHLERTGYEESYGQVTFETKGEENLQTLIDLSLGYDGEVELTSSRAVDSRFGIVSKEPTHEFDGGKLKILDVTPISKGKISFRKDVLSAGITRHARFYWSPFNKFLPDHMQKARIESDILDITLYPFSGESPFTFSVGNNEAFDIDTIRQTINLIEMIRTSHDPIVCEYEFDGLPKINHLERFEVGEYDYEAEKKAIESAIRLREYFDIQSVLLITLSDIRRYSDQIRALDHAVHNERKMDYIIEYNCESDLDSCEETVCIAITNTMIGNYVVGVIVSAKGNAEKTDAENGRYRLVTNNITVEKRIAIKSEEDIDKAQLVRAIEQVEEKYKNSQVVTFFDKDITSVGRE